MTISEMTTLNEQLIEQSKKGDLVRVKELLRNGANVNAKHDYGQTALHLSTERGHTKVVGLLLEYGADIHAKTCGGWTALHYGANGDHTDVVRLLLNMELIKMNYLKNGINNELSKNF